QARSRAMPQPAVSRTTSSPANPGKSTASPPPKPSVLPPDLTDLGGRGEVAGCPTGLAEVPEVVKPEVPCEVPAPGMGLEQPSGQQKVPSTIAGESTGASFG